MKKVLLITPRFMGLDDLIRDELSAQFLEVHHRYDRMESLFFKFIIRANVIGLRDWVASYFYGKLIRSIDKSYDNAVVINPETMPVKFLRAVANRAKKTSVYFWDGSVTKPLIETFSSVEGVQFFSFDKRDCEEFNFGYLPLFIPNVSPLHALKDIDFSFIASCHGKRLELAEKLTGLLNGQPLTAVVRVCSSSAIHFVFYNLIAIVRRYQTRVKLTGLPHDQYLRVLERTKVVIDMTSDSKQAGVSMRTFEALGHGCKLLTNNRALKDEEFFDDGLVFFYTDLPTKNDLEAAVFKDAPSFSTEDYSIHNFIKVLVG